MSIGSGSKFPARSPPDLKSELNIIKQKHILCIIVIFVATEGISSVAKEDISSVAKEDIPSVATEDISSVATKDISSAGTKDISSAGTEDPVHLLGPSWSSQPLAFFACKSWQYLLGLILLMKSAPSFFFGKSVQANLKEEPPLGDISPVYGDLSPV
jgi:hypothetical protein